MSKDENQNDDNQDLEEKKDDAAQEGVSEPEDDLDENEEGDASEGSSIFKSKGLLVLGLIIFVGLLFFAQQYLHFGDDKDQKEVSHTHDGSGAPVIPAVQPKTAPSVSAKNAHKDLHKKDIPHTHGDSQGAVAQPSVKAVPESAPVDSVHGMPVQDDKEIEEVVRKYIESNPEVVAKALQNLNEKMSKDRDVKSKSYLKDNMEKITSNRPYLGNSKGNTKIVEFFDYKCSYCRRSHIVLERVLKDYPDVKLILQPVPVLGKNSAEAVRASLSVWKLFPDHFEKFHEDLINSPTIDDNSILDIARKHGLSTDALTKEMKSQDIQKLVNENLEIAQNVGMRGVPTFIVKGELVPGSLSYEGFKDLLGDSKSRK
ncbi:MAG: DsbA family protein [Alphaproteobacteria bacterium]|nr:DsbA family protein [Alphaproteobacteria bacterium]